MVFSIIALAGTAWTLSIAKSQKSDRDEYTAGILLEECGEAVRSIRDRNFANLQNGIFGLSITQDTYQLTQEIEKIDQFERKIETSPVNRDNNNDIAEIGILDPQTKKISCAISWKSIYSSTKEQTITMYLSNWQNKDFLETQERDFKEGELMSAEIVNSPSPPNDNGSLTLEKNDKDKKNELEDEAYKKVGEYTSKIFNTRSIDTAYFTISIDSTSSPGGSIKIQMRTAKDKGTIKSADFIGPDGTSSTYYENPLEKITLNPKANGTRYVQYKAFLQGDGNTSPELKSVAINFR